MVHVVLRSLVVLGLAGVPALANPVVLVDRSATGLTAPNGMVVDSGGALWVTDDDKGVCRVDLSAAAPLVPSAYCRPADGPPARLGPERPSGLAYDPTSETLLVGDRGSNSGSVWRMPIVPGGQILSAERITGVLPDRVVGVSYASDGGPHLHYTTTLSPAVYRIANPVTCAPASLAGCPSAIVGWGRDTDLLDELDGDIYLADKLGGPMRLRGPGPSHPAAEPLDLDLASGSDAVAVDHARGRVYFAVTEAGVGDRVDVLDVASGVSETYLAGPTAAGRFGSVTSMAVEPGGDLLVADDLGSAVGSEDLATGTTRLYRAAFGQIPAPRVRIAAGPPAIGRGPAAEIRYRSSAGAAFACRVDGGSWTPCGTGPWGVFTTAPLADGPHVVEVRAENAFGLGPAARRELTIDTIAPDVRIDNPPTDRVAIGGAFSLRFSAAEPVLFECSAGDAPFLPCIDGWRADGLTDGVHLLSVRAIDLAGNVGPAATIQVRSGAPVASLVAPIVVPKASLSGPKTAPRARVVCSKGRRLVAQRRVVLRHGQKVRVVRRLCVAVRKRAPRR